MKEITARGLANAMSSLLSTPEFDQVRRFLVADASAEKSEADEIIKTVNDHIRAHLIEHGKSVRAVAVQKRAV